MTCTHQETKRMANVWKLTCTRTPFSWTTVYKHYSLNKVVYNYFLQVQAWTSAKLKLGQSLMTQFHIKIRVLSPFASLPNRGANNIKAPKPKTSATRHCDKPRIETYGSLNSNYLLKISKTYWPDITTI